MTYKEIRANEEVNALLDKGNKNLGLLGFTDHSQAHCIHVADTAGHILKKFGYDAHDIELAKIAGYMHDIGNCVNRTDHAQSGAIMAFRILDNMGASADDIATIITAIGNHDEGTAVPVNPITASLILADKTDVRASRVRNTDIKSFDIHDRVNYSVKRADLDISTEKKEIELKLQIDTGFCSVMDYFEIFLGRMILCRKAAEKLGLRFRLSVNGQILL